MKTTENIRLQIIIIAIALILLPATCTLADEWTNADTQWEIAYQVVHAVDWGQTRYIAEHPDEFHEMNPILGEHPSVGSVDAYFITTGVVHYLIARKLPSKYRRAWQVVFTIDHAQAVANNYQLGIKVKF